MAEPSGLQIVKHGVGRDCWVERYYWWRAARVREVWSPRDDRAMMLRSVERWRMEPGKAEMRYVKRYTSPRVRGARPYYRIRLRIDRGGVWALGERFYCLEAIWPGGERRRFAMIEWPKGLEPVGCSERIKSGDAPELEEWRAGFGKANFIDTEAAVLLIEARGGLS